MNVYELIFPGRYAGAFAIISAESPEEAKAMAAKGLNSYFQIRWDKPESCEVVSGLSATEAAVHSVWSFGE